MNILISTFTFPPEVGGVAEVARTEVYGFRARGHSVSVATTFGEGRSECDAPAGVQVHQFRITGNFELGCGYEGEVQQYQSFLAHHPADIVLFHCWQTWNLDLAVPVLPKIGARTVLLSHGVDAQTWKPHSRFPWGLMSWARAQPYVWRLPRLMKRLDRLVFLSDRCDTRRYFDHWLARRFCPERITIIPNGVHRRALETGSRGEFRKTFNIPTQYLALNVANYTDRKNQMATLRAFMAANRADTTLVFVGGEFNEYQTAVARQYEKSRHRFPEAKVVFLEKVPKELINAAYRDADLFVLTAKHETQPLAILDAMAAGVPFVSTNVGSVSEFPGGLVVPTGPSTVEAIHRLLNHEDLRRKLGDQGQEACRVKYDWDKVLDQYEVLFHQLLQASPRSALASS